MFVTPHSLGHPPNAVQERSMANARAIPRATDRTGSGKRTERIHDAHCDWTRRERRSLYDSPRSAVELYAPPHHLHRRPSEPSSRVARSRSGGGDGDRYPLLTFPISLSSVVRPRERAISFFMSAACPEVFLSFTENQFGGFVQNSSRKSRAQNHKHMGNLLSIAIRSFLPHPATEHSQ